MNTEKIHALLNDASAHASTYFETQLVKIVTELVSIAPPPPPQAQWIPLSERRPTEADWDATRAIELCYTPTQARETYYSSEFGLKAIATTQWTHWRRVNLPPLPTPEPVCSEAKVVTQEKDRSAYISEARKIYPTSTCDREAFIEGAKFAFSHERAHLGMPAEEFVKQLRDALESNPLESANEVMSTEKTTLSNAEFLMAKGYRITSRKHRLVSRIDRPDWRLVSGELNRLPESQAEDQYRRCYSQDSRTVSQHTMRGMRSSIGAKTGFIQPKP